MGGRGKSSRGGGPAEDLRRHQARWPGAGEGHEKTPEHEGLSAATWNKSPVG